MRPYLYRISTGPTFNQPKQPGYLPEIPYGSTRETTSKLVRHHKVHKTQFDITKAFDYTMKQQIPAASHNDYVEGAMYALAMAIPYNK